MTHTALPVVLLLIGAIPLFAAPVELYVATSGNDGWSGTLAAAIAAKTDGPFTTLSRARDELRRLRASDGLPEGATVHVRRGLYRLTEPLKFGPEDAGIQGARVVWRAYQREAVTLAGAVPVSGFSPWKEEILVADLRGTPLDKVAFRQLFCGGARQTMARYPNVDPTDPHGGQWAHVLYAEPAAATNRSVSDNVPAVKDHFTATGDVIKPTWEKVQQAEVAIHPAYGWAWNVVPIASVEDEQDEIHLGKPVSYGLMVGDRYFVQNLLVELDAPGEWYLDREGARLYFWPPESAKADEVTVPVSDSLLVAEETHDIIFRGLNLEQCGGTAVSFKDCERVIVAGCTIRNTGSWGVTIVGGRHSGAQGNDIYATGAGGVSINAGDRATLIRGDCFADNNYIHHIAAFQRTYNTGVNLSGVGNRAAHNLIHDCYHQALLIGGNDQLVEYNIVHHTNLGSEDTGGLYMSSRDYTCRGTVIRYNILHHIGGFGKANSWRPVRNGQVEFRYPGFTWGIYLDAPEVGCRVFGNVLYSVPVCGMFNHEGRDNRWENNIIVDAPAFRVSSGNYPDLDRQSYSYIETLRNKGGYDTFLEHYPELASYTDDTASHNTCAPGEFVRNIVYYTAEGGRMMREQNQAAWGDGQLVFAFRGPQSAFESFRFDGNCVHAPPELALKLSLTVTPGPEKLLTWEQWRQTGQDPSSVLADPLFVDAEKHDFRLRPESPALKLGFRQIPLEQIGPYEEELRATWPVVEAPGAAALGDFTTRRYFKLPGQEPVPATEVQTRGGLANLAAKLAAGRPVTIVAFAGGSHAQGGWTKQVQEWLRATYPQAKATVVNASIHGGFRGSGPSVFRFGHDALRHRPDLVVIDFAADDGESDAEAVRANAEGMVRQAWKSAPETDILFVYAFRQGYESDYEKGLCPSAVSAYERVAQHYAIPSVNMGVRLAAMAREGKLILKASAEETAGTPDVPVFSSDGVHTTPAGSALYAQTITEGLETLLATGTQGPHVLPNTMRGGNMEGAVQIPITREMLSGDWEQVTPPAIGTGRFDSHFESLWVTRSPGAALTFTFTGTRAWVFDVFGPGTGCTKVTIDGTDKGVRQQVDPWSYYYRIGGLELGSNLPPGEHTVRVELLPETPDRTVPIEAARKAGQYKPEDFEGVALHFGAICVVETVE